MNPREIVKDRCQGNCERCGQTLSGKPASIHHRRPRGTGGTKDPHIDDPTNLVVLCGSGTTGCHGWVESHRAQAWEQGWLVPRRDPRTPAQVPLYTRGAWYTLTATHMQPHNPNPPF